MPDPELARATLERLYAALNAHDGDGMAACYAAGATFKDPAFGLLEGARVGGMWRMLCGRATDLVAELSNVKVSADGTSATGHWRAVYAFGATGRNVINEIDGSYRFDDAGLIVEHEDRFDQFKWARQALGPVGFLLGSNPVGQGLLRKRANGQLDAFLAA